MGSHQHFLMYKQCLFKRNIKAAILAQLNAELCIKKKSCTVWGSDLSLSGSDSRKDSQCHQTEPHAWSLLWALQVKAGGLWLEAWGILLFVQHQISDTEASRIK